MGLTITPYGPNFWIGSLGADEYEADVDRTFKKNLCPKDLNSSDLKDRTSRSD